MDKPILRITLYATVIYLTGWLLTSAVASPPSLWGHGTHSHGHRDSKAPDNRNYARRFAANLNRGEPRTVRMIYFLPNDRLFRADVVQNMKDTIRRVQTFFAEQMEAHGYGRRTFRVETDPQGEPIVHRMDGRHPDSYYLVETSGAVVGEVGEAFDLNANVYLIIIDNSSGRIHLGGGDTAGGIGSNSGKNGGWALFSSSVGVVQYDLDFFGVAAHELGHSFGLSHDFRDHSYIMSYGQNADRLSACNAEYLSVHPYFNLNTPIEDGEPPTIELVSPLTYPIGSQSVPIQLKVSDSDGLHQLILLATTIAPHQAQGFREVKTCRRLVGDRDTVVRFDYDGGIPSDFTTSLLRPVIHPMAVVVVDMEGNVGAVSFELAESSGEGDTGEGDMDEIYIPDPNLRAAIAEAVGVSPNSPIVRGQLKKLLSLTAQNAGISDLTGLEAAVNLKELDLGMAFENTSNPINSNSVSDISPLMDLTNLTGLNLGGNSITDISPVADLTNLRLLELRDNGISDISPVAGLTNLASMVLWYNNISDISPLAGLTKLKVLWLDNNNISDISPLAGLTNLIMLNLGGNSITDISPLAGLTDLRNLRLDNNNISDISPVAGLTNLTGLWLRNNNISDISPLAGLTNLKSLWLGNNNISDISALAGLTRLTTGLDLSGNSITDLSPVAGLTNLKLLLLDNNNISDISLVAANTGFGSGSWVGVSGNPLNYQSIHTHIPTLQSKDVLVQFDNRKVQSVVKVSGDNQQGTVGEMLADPFVVEVTDERGTAFTGVPVTFTVTEGSGTVSVTSTTTDENGRAQSTLTLGPDLGPNTVLVSAAGTEMQVIFNTTARPLTSEYLWSIPAGISLIHVPLKVTAVDGITKTIESVGALYEVLGKVLDSENNVTYLATHAPGTEEEWRVYLGDSQRDTNADRALTDDMAIVANLITDVSVLLTGSALGTGGSSTITLTPGLNFVGLPLRDEEINRMSDLLRLDGIRGNVSLIASHWGNESNQVRQPGDPGDIAITGGQGFMLAAQQPATVTISGEAWTNEPAAVSPAAHRGIEVRDTTPVLALRGAVVDERTGADRDDFRVIAKNLSTGRAATAITSPNEAGYRLIVVDMETGQAAMIGDTLEISAQSPDPFIGVEPLRYTVTAEDVRRSLIELPVLVTYEIPRETQLLANYPNPFNPETWIPYRLAEDAFVSLTIYDGIGQVVRTLEVGHRVAAVYESRSRAVYWDGRNEFGEQVASGVYFYQLRAGDYSTTRKMVILK